MKTDLFLELELPDIENKLRELLFSKHALKVWRDSENFTSLKIYDVHEESIKVDKDDLLAEGELYYCSFLLREMHYYCRVNYKVEDGTSYLTPSGPIYRSERRRGIRYLMHPSTNAYLYFLMESNQSSQPDNVVSINRAQNLEKQMFSDFVGDIKNLPELSGESILDLSEGGLSFTCSGEELKLIKHAKPSSGTIILFGKNVKLENIEVIYEVDYLNARLEAVAMKKVGVKFSPSEELNELLASLNDDSIVLTSLDEDFQKFVDQNKE